MKRLIAAAVLCGAAAAAHADAVQTLRDFVRDVKSGRAQFTQTVTSPDGARTKQSAGSFEFQRPNRFRFVYTKPEPQTLVADGQKVWIHDPDLNQVSSRPLSRALGSTPAALLAGGNLDADFVLVGQPAAEGLDWALATPKAKDSAFQAMRVGFRGTTLAVVEVVDSFGQRSRLQFSGFAANVALPPETFRFVVPQGADVSED